MAGGQVQCWGRNADGQLGDGTTTSSSPPVTVTGLAGTPTALAAGGAHTCALLAGGQVQCWGSSLYGQLGTSLSSWTPVTVTGLAGTATALVAGGAHTCALLAGGQVQCWGRNADGQLGDGTTTSSSTPVTVTGLAGTPTALVAGGAHTCALLAGGQVQCWGFYALDLGHGTTTSPSTPVTVTGLAGTATALVAGGAHTCALLAGGQVQCWGGNVAGQLGDGTTTFSSTAVTVTALAGTATALAAGGEHTCALLAGGQVQCWGGNLVGQLGDGTTTSSPTPVTVTGLAGTPTTLTAGDSHTCALLADGQVQCWGRNFYRQLGDGTTTNSSTPVTVTGLAGPVLQPGDGVSSDTPPAWCGKNILFIARGSSEDPHYLTTTEFMGWDPSNHGPTFQMIDNYNDMVVKVGSDRYLEDLGVGGTLQAMNIRLGGVRRYRVRGPVVVVADIARGGRR